MDVRTIRVRFGEGRHSEQVDFDELTPRARALAECLDPGEHRAVTIVLESRTATAPDPSPEVLAAYGDRRPAGPALQSRTFRFMAGDDPRAAADWLEERARDIPAGWYPVARAGAFWDRPADLVRVPSADAAAGDRYLSRDMVLDHMRAAGQPMGIQAWDTLRGTGHLPEPDRYVRRRPLWLPETIDAYLGREREQWTVTQVAEFLGYEGDAATGAARRQLFRWGLSAQGRAPGRGGESLYAADQVRAARRRHPGRGRPRKDAGTQDA